MIDDTKTAADYLADITALWRQLSVVSPSHRPTLTPAAVQLEREILRLGILFKAAELQEKTKCVEPSPC